MRTQLYIIWHIEHVENKQWTWMNWKPWITTQEPWHYSSSCCLSIQPFLQKNYPPPHFRIRFVKLLTDLFILLAFAAFFHLFSFFVIFFWFLLCFVVFLFAGVFLAAFLLASQGHCNFCYFLLSAMVGLLCLRIMCPESKETEKSHQGERCPDTRFFYSWW